MENIVRKIKKLNGRWEHLGQCLGAAFHAPTRSQAQCVLFAVGVLLLGLGTVVNVDARIGAEAVISYNDDRVTDSVNAILTYIEGSFGALIMIAAGLGAIISSAFGQYRAALGLLVVAVGAFILRSLVSTFFNDSRIQS